MHKITEEFIRGIYVQTHYHGNGLNLDIIFEKGHDYKEKGGWGDQYNLVCYLLEIIGRSYPEYKFGAICLHSDGGIKDYMITYDWGDHKIIITREINLHRWTTFSSVKNFCDWLNNHAEFIKLNTREGGSLKHA